MNPIRVALFPVGIVAALIADHILGRPDSCPHCQPKYPLP